MDGSFVTRRSSEGRTSRLSPWPLALLLSIVAGCPRPLPVSINVPILDPPQRPTRACRVEPEPQADAAVTVPAATPVPSPALSSLRTRARSLAGLRLQRGDREAIERSLSMASQELRSMSAIGDDLAAQSDLTQNAVALSIVGACYERVADLELHAHEFLDLSPEQTLSQTRMTDEAARLERQARHQHGSARARLIEQATRIRTRAATLLQASATNMQERHALTSRQARIEAVIRYGRAALIADRRQVGHGVEEVDRCLERLTDPSLQDVVTEAMQRQTEYTYTPGMFQDMRDRWGMGY